MYSPVIAPELLLAKGMVPWPAPGARAGNIEHAKAALLIAQEAVIHEVSVDVISRDRA